MLSLKLRVITTFIFALLLLSGCTQTLETKHVQFDVLHYHVQLKPDLEQKSLTGEVEIEFTMNATTKQASFDCGQLIIDQVTGTGVQTYRQEKQKVIVEFLKEGKTERKIKINYHGSPARGVVFLPKQKQLYTVFFTNEWMVCHDNPADKASFSLDLQTPKGLTAIASGNLMTKRELTNGVNEYLWKQDYETPAYTYGFAIGEFEQVQEVHHNVVLNYYASDHSSEELKTIFEMTPDMLAFFEEKSGIPFPQKSYSQLLMGNHYQEMSGFAVLKKGYGELVLKDRTETNLISHELAHQWWGNRITCVSWNHFWLNEGFATFMSAAYNEHRFGKEKYEENIEAYRQAYEKVKDKGADKPLVFPNWSKPTADDRTLVYFKGAYVLHLLRKELGDEAFWTGIKAYSQKYVGKAVNTQQFQQLMEESSHQNLQNFFDEWLY